MRRDKLLEVIFTRVLFTLFVIFLSFQILTGFKEAKGETGSLTQSRTSEWTPGSPVITFYLKDYSLLPRVRVLVNDEVKGSFNNRYVTVEVHQGDIIHLDGTFYNSPVNIEVLSVTRGIIHPRGGEIFRLNGNLLSLGKVAAAGQ